MATVTKFANANTVVTTGWTNASNAYADDGSYATATPAKNSSVVTDYGTAAFTSGDIPDNSVINSVTIEAQYKSDVTNSTNATFGLRLNDNGSLHTETTFGMATTDQTVTRANSSAVTLANLRVANTVRARVTGLRANSNNGIVWSCDYVKLTVDYTAPSNGTATPAGVSTTSSLGTAVGVGPGTGSPTGFSSTTSLGSTTQTGDGSKAAAGNATTSSLGTAPGTGAGTSVPTGFEINSALGTVTATGEGGEAPPEPEPDDSAAAWARYFSAPLRRVGLAFPGGVSTRAELGHATANGSAGTTVRGVSFRLSTRNAQLATRASARAHPRAPAPMRLMISAPRPSVSVSATPRRPLRPITFTDEEMTALVLLLE